MGAYSLGAVLKKWEQGELSTEQAVGQTLQIVQELSERVGKLERRMIGERPSGVERPSSDQRPSPPSPKESL